MYIPTHFEETNRNALQTVMRDYDFATLVTPQDDPLGLPMITHLPLLLEDEDRLLGHMARTNPHWRLFDEDRPSLAVFHGPHGYVSPRWYASSKNVPTWNYVSVHASGPAKPVTDQNRCLEVMEKLVGRYETGPDAWRMDILPDKAFDGLMRGIVVFEMPIDKLEGKFKLSQNRTTEDQEGVIRHLSNSVQASDRELAAWMAKACDREAG